MFQKPTFGSNTSGFGSFNTGATASSPFGGFKPAAGASAFGAPPAFGATPANTAPGGGLFGQTNTTGGLFGASTSTNPTPSFGSSGFGSFGASTSTGGLFGANTPSTGGLFGNNQNANAFGAKPAGFGFGATASAAPTTGGLFSSPASTNTGGLFSSQPAGGGLFSSGGAFGQQQASGTAHVKYQPVAGTDVVVKGGNSQTVNIRHHCITCMKEYETKSLEELRLEDYTAGRKGSSGMFGFQQPADNTVKPLFNTGAFGQTATTTAPSLFGGGSMANTSGFGQTNTFSFGNNAQNTSTTGLFGANKPAFGATPTTGTSLFGATTTQAPAFGTNTSTFGFGSNTQNQQTGGLFGAKPATGAFGAPATSTGFGAFGGGGLFGAKTAQTSAPTFGTTTPAFGANTSAFGANTSTSLFGGGSTFGKPATSQPAFGFNSQPQMGTGQNTGLGTSFQAKPTAFNNLGTGTSLFSQPNYNLQSGLNLGLGGGGLFNNNTSLGGTGLGLGQNNANTSMVQSGGLGAPAGSNVHEQILTLAARPYGDSPLFKDLLPDTSTTAEDVLKPTNPVAVKAILDGSSGYSVTSPPPPPLRVVPRALARDKKSLFDGLEESDASLEDKLSLKPSRKRLVLRPKKDGNDSLNRSLEDQSRQQENGPKQSDQLSMDRVDHDISNREREGDERRSSERKQYEELQADKQNSWPSRSSWENQEKPIDNDPTPRLYPNLDKELPAHISERRASWLTTKPLRKPLVSNPDLVENSVRELGVRTDKSTPSNNDKENIDSFYVSEEDNVSTREVPPHPAGVKLTRPGYYTIPSLEEMTKYLRPDGTCVVPHLTIGRRNYGNVFYNCEIDVAGLDLDALVHFLNKEVIIYPEDGERPPVGEGLNRKAIVTLDRVWPRDKTEKRPVTEPERLLKMDFEGKLRRVCDKHDTQFIEYRPQTGSWVFKVEHFSKYGLTESDEEDEITPEVMKRQLVTQTLQKAAPVAAKPPVGAPTRSPLAPATGLGGLASLGGDDVFLQTSLNLMNGSRGFEMDTTEDNTEGASLYQDSRAFGVKSPTSELARLEHRQSHNVQLMKASLYADTEMEDDVSISTGDQLVPHASSAIMTVPTPSISHKEVVEETPIIVNEPVMRPLIVQPHTVILEYNRKIPPFKKTIAGRLNASCIADMSVCRARHTRVCFGPENQMLYLTTARVVAAMPKDSAMSELDRYVCGRADDDWSEAILARVQLGRAEVKAVQDLLSKQLASLLEFSTLDATTTRPVARLVVRQSPADRKRLLDTLLADAEKGEEFVSAFGVSSAFCVEVWKLCEALWGDDLLNDGIPGTDEQSVVSRHTNFLNWLKDAVAKSTYKDLATSTIVPEDDKDAHSASVWTLFVGGRILEACKLCKQHGDLNMAALIAQASGDPFFKTLISRQLKVWRECGADELVSPHKMALLCLLAGRSPGAELQTLDWLRVLHVCARYICPQIPSLERIVRTYEALFSRESNVDLASLPEENVTMRLPIPDYCEDYTVSVETNGKSRRVLDLRYELIRARAFNTRPRLSPATYTPHPIDYSLSFLISAWFGTPSAESVVGIAEQLEGYGLWHLAVQALLYHPDDGVRSHLVRSVLSRHAPAQADTAELKSRLDLLRKLGVPEKWILIAQAHRAKYENRRQLEVEHLVSAECYSDAHSVLVEHILPDVVLSDNVKSIQPIIEKLHAAAQRDEVSGWERGGEALYHYIHVCDEIRGLVSDAEGDQPTSVQERLEALTPMVTAAARALIAWDCTSARARAARTQMGARLVRLAPRAPLLRDLRLPPDTAAPAHRQIATELAERAAELCLGSAAGDQSGP